MAIPLPTASSIKQTAMGAASISTLMHATVAWSAVSHYRERVQHGQNPIFAALMEAGQVLPQYMMEMPAMLAFQFGIPMARAATAAVIGAVKDHNNFIRHMRTPFSHRYEASDVAARAQQMGLQAISGAWGHAQLGSEAASFARRYGR